MTSNTDYITTLQNQIRDGFSRSELQELCYSLHIEEVEVFDGDTESVIRELLLYMCRIGKLPELIEMLMQLRPYVAWATVPASIKIGFTSGYGEPIDYDTPLVTTVFVSEMETERYLRHPPYFSRSFVQSRRFEAAMPKSVYAGDTTELLVMIPRLEDLGLCAFLPIETETGDLITKDDVSSLKLKFEFPETPVLVYVKIETSSYDFEVETPLRTIKIYPDREGDYETFFLTALRVIRRARVAVRLFIDKELTDSLGTLRLYVPIKPDNSGAGRKLAEERIFMLAHAPLTYIAGDSVGGDKINATIKDSSGVAMGREASATVTA